MDILGTKYFIGCNICLEITCTDINTDFKENYQIRKIIYFSNINTWNELC